MGEVNDTVASNPNWKLKKQYDTSVPFTGKVNVYSFVPHSMVTLTCWPDGDSLLSMYGNVENIEDKVSVLERYGLL